MELSAQALPMESHTSSGTVFGTQESGLKGLNDIISSEDMLDGSVTFDHESIEREANAY